MDHPLFLDVLLNFDGKYFIEDTRSIHRITLEVSVKRHTYSTWGSTSFLGFESERVRHSHGPKLGPEGPNKTKTSNVCPSREIPLL